jgi:hypothetical protein
MKPSLFPIVAFILILSSCAPSLVEWNSSYSVNGYDFRDYTAKNFLFTPNQYLEAFDAIGLVEVTFTPEIKKRAISSTGHAIPEEGYTIIYGYDTAYLVQEPNTKLLVEQLYQVCKEMGADAVMQIRIESEYLDNNGHKIRTIKMSGFAIKRL